MGGEEFSFVQKATGEHPLEDLIVDNNDEIAKEVTDFFLGFRDTRQDVKILPGAFGNFKKGTTGED